MNHSVTHNSTGESEIQLCSQSNFIISSVGVMKQLLLNIGAITESNIEILQTFTRDREVNVYIDRSSKVIFIDDFYVGEDEYRTGEYRLNEIPSS